MIEQLGVFIMDLLHILVSPEYGAEALKVGAVYLMFRKDIKSLGEQVSQLATSMNRRVGRIETHLGLSDESDTDTKEK